MKEVRGVKIRILRLLLVQEYPLSYREIAAKLKKDVSTIYQHVKELEVKGLVVKRKMLARTLHITPDGVQLLMEKLKKDAKK